MTKNQKLPPLEDEFSTLTHVLNPAHACRAWLWEIKKEDCWRQGHGKIYASTRHLALVKKIFAIGAWLLLLIPCTSQGDEQWNFVTVTSASGKKLYVGLLEACTEEKTCIAPSAVGWEAVAGGLDEFPQSVNAIGYMIWLHLLGAMAILIVSYLGVWSHSPYWMPRKKYKSVTRRWQGLRAPIVPAWFAFVVALGLTCGDYLFVMSTVSVEANLLKAAPSGLAAIAVWVALQHWIIRKQDRKREIVFPETNEHEKV